MIRRIFDPRGALALEPSALGRVVGVAEDAPEVLERDGVVVVTVRGALMHHADACFDSYDAIRDRFADAFSRGKPVVLEMDSPGGSVSGCFETARDVRAMADRAGVPFVCYVDGTAASAAYALACAADVIVVPEAGVVGSIGVIEGLRDERAAAAAFGIVVALVTSGARKADGNPLAGISDDVLRAAQSRVDTLAGQFFALVSERRGLSVDAVRALEAGTVIGPAALAARLADVVMTRGQLFGALAAGGVGALTKGRDAMATKAEEKKSGGSVDEMIAALRAAAEGDGEGADKARRMLKALDAEGAEPDGDEAPPAKAEGEDAPKEEKPKAEAPPAKDEETKAMARAALASSERTERLMLLGTRGDFSPEQRATLERAPLAVVRDAVRSWPKVAAPRAAAEALAMGTRGMTDAGVAEGSSERGAGLVGEAASDLDARMGLVAMKPTVRDEGTRLVLGVWSKGK